MTTVKDLIEQLSIHDPDMEVVLWEGHEELALGDNEVVLMNHVTDSGDTIVVVGSVVDSPLVVVQGGKSAVCTRLRGYLIEAFRADKNVRADVTEARIKQVSEANPEVLWRYGNRWGLTSTCKDAEVLAFLNEVHVYKQEVPDEHGDHT